MTIFDKEKKSSLFEFQNTFLLDIHSRADAAASRFRKLRTGFRLVNAFPGSASGVVQFLEAAQDGVSPVVVAAAGPAHVAHHCLHCVHLELLLRLARTLFAPVRAVTRSLRQDRLCGEILRFQLIDWPPEIQMIVALGLV